MRAPRCLLLPALFLGGAGLLAAQSAAVPGPPDVAAARRLFDSWKAPVPPRLLLDNLYYVGASGVSSYLLTTPEGHILIDTGFDDTVPLIQRSVEQLGFRVEDIKLILSSHAHIDHTGGHARMKKLTGAQVVASAADARVLASGGADDFIPFPRETILYEPVTADRIVADGEKVRWGGVELTAHLTPGHTRGATTWTMNATAAGKRYRVVFFSSASINAGTRLLSPPAYPGIAEDLAATFGKLRALPCDIFLAPHGGQFAMADKFARLERGEGAAALVDPAGWNRLLDQMEQAYRDTLARQTRETNP